MGSLGFQELLVILLIALLIFGGSRLPGIAAGLGGAVHSFKKALRGAADDDRALAQKNEEDRVPAQKASSDTAAKS